MSKVKCVRRRFVWALALVAAFAAADAQRKAGDLSIKPYVSENAKGEKVDAEFGTLVVP